MRPFGPTFVPTTTKIKLKGHHGYSLKPDKPPFSYYTFEVDSNSGKVGFKSGDLYLSGKEAKTHGNVRFNSDILPP